METENRFVYLKNCLRTMGFTLDLSAIKDIKDGKQLAFTNSQLVVNYFNTGTIQVQGKGNIETFQERLSELMTGDKKLSPINEHIISLVREQQEGPFVDFKQTYNTGKAQNLIHDILALVNKVESGDSYLIFGVADDGSVVGCEGQIRLLSNNLYDTFSKVMFAGNNQPELCVEEIYYQDKVLDVLVIKESNAVPFYISEAPDSYSVLVGRIYSRFGDTNTPKNKSADYETIKKLWEIHFNGKR